jgi:hypothetical protein
MERKFSIYSISIEQMSDEMRNRIKLSDFGLEIV